MAMIETKNFNPLHDKKLLCACGHPDCDRRSVDQDTLDKVQLIRDDIGRPLTITSGGRCPHHPNEKTKPQPGDHQKCKAVDISCTDNGLETKLKVLAGRHGATRVAGGAYCGFVHIAWTPTEKTDVPTWRY
jgi:zinc D-Ala-D-Ala carboxypeptidase